MEQTPIILRIAVPAPLDRCFDYLTPLEVRPEKFVVGSRVKINFGRRKMVGVIAEIATTSELPLHKLKPVLEILDPESLFPSTVFTMLRWASEYYHHPLGEVIACALPTLLGQGKPAAYSKKLSKQVATVSTKTAELLKLNPAQQQATDQIVTAFGQFQTFVLDGVTGSGKTEVYLHVVQAALQAGKQALVLVPEIGLTPQIIARFKQHFTQPIAVLHSGLTDRERKDAWLLANDGKVNIIIGTRSAIFSPLCKPGVIIIDEEHDLSFKQQEGFRYSARDCAIVRARLENIPIVLGSATPSIESLYNVDQKRYQSLSLPKRAADAVPPEFYLLDVRNQKLDNGLSPQLIGHIQRHLQQDGQVLLFLNRRGFAPVLICHGCGWVAGCKRCDTKMTLHQSPAGLQCHHCGAQRRIDSQCPDCKNQSLMPLGLGTQRLEETLNKHFPDTGIVRIDRDSTRLKGTLEDILQSIHDGKNKILIGTQMLAKGHHFPDVTLVAILNADNGLFSADFRASERIAQLLIQVAGRAGRAERRGEVMIQTHNPEHPLLQLLLSQNYSVFAQAALKERSAANLPPYSYFALLRAEATAKEQPLNFLTQVREFAKKQDYSQVEILGPMPSLIERKAGRFRAQLLIQASQRAPLHRLLSTVLIYLEKLPTTRQVRWSLDVDPLDIM